MVGATFLATNFRPSLDMIRQYDRKSLENNTHPAAAVLPGDRLPAHSGPFNAQRPARLAQPAQGVHVPAGDAVESGGAPAREQILTTLARRAYRRPPTAQDVAALMTFFDEGRKDATFDDGIELALRVMLASPQFLVRAEREPGRASPAGQPIASPISSWRRGCRSSSGAASRTTS